MKTRTLFLAALTVAFFSSFSSSARADDTFHVSLSNGDVLLSAASPVPSGSMLLVKNLSDGSITAVPSELVSNVSKVSKPRTAGSEFATKTLKMKNVTPTSRIVTMTNLGTGAKSIDVFPAGEKLAPKLTAAKMAGTLANARVPATLAAGKLPKLLDSVRISKTEGGLTPSLNNGKPTAPAKRATTILTSSLEPGQKVFLGPTGGTSAAASRADTSVVSPRAASFALSVDPLSATIRDQVFAGDLPRLTPRAGLTAGTVTPITGEVVIGPNGFPVPVTATTASGVSSIGPNGFPATGTTVSAAGLTRAGGSITNALPVTTSAATAAAAGAISVPAGSPATGAAPAAASPR